MSAWTAEQVCTAFLTCKLSCEQFLNSINSKFFEGGGGGGGGWLEKSHNLRPKTGWTKKFEKVFRKAELKNFRNKKSIQECQLSSKDGISAQTFSNAGLTVAEK